MDNSELSERIDDYEQFLVWRYGGVELPKEEIENLDVMGFSGFIMVSPSEREYSEPLVMHTEIRFNATFSARRHYVYFPQVGPFWTKWFVDERVGRT